MRHPHFDLGTELRHNILCRFSGSALAAQLRAPDCQIIGVEPKLGDDAGRSWREGVVIKLESVPETVADGLRTRAIGQRNLEIMRRYVSDMISVSEADMTAEIRVFTSSRKGPYRSCARDLRPAPCAATTPAG
mgnify:CR=1 FL=1